MNRSEEEIFKSFSDYYTKSAMFDIFYSNKIYTYGGKRTNLMEETKEKEEMEEIMEILDNIEIGESNTIKINNKTQNISPVTQLVMSRANVSEEKAKDALLRNNGSMVNAILELDNNKLKEENVVFPIADIKSVMSQANVSEKIAINALYENNGSIYGSIVKLSQPITIPVENIKLIMSQIDVSVSEAKSALIKSRGDIVDAFTELLKESNIDSNIDFSGEDIKLVMTETNATS